jgi:hypothetical protein
MHAHIPPHLLMFRSKLKKQQEYDLGSSAEFGPLLDQCFSVNDREYA